MVFNFTEPRAKIDVTIGSSSTDKIPNGTLVFNPQNIWQSGYNVLYNDTSIQQFQIAFNGKNNSKSIVVMNAARCDGACPLPNITEFNGTGPGTTTKACRWSDPNSWLSGHVPLDGETVEVTQDCTYFWFDVEVSAIVEVLYINTIFIFEDGFGDRHLRAKYIFVRKGQIWIGNSTNYFTRKARITLYGEYSSRNIVYKDCIEGGNKILVATNLVQMYGRPRSASSRLLSITNRGDTSFYVSANLDWQAGERIAISASGMNYTEFEEFIILAYNSNTGLLNVSTPVNFYHYGAGVSQ